MVTSAPRSRWKPQQRVVVHLVDMIAGQEQHLVDRPGQVQVEAHRVGRALLPARRVAALRAHVRLQQADAAGRAVQVPRPAQADVLVQRAGLVLRQHRHVEDARVDAVGQREVDHPVLARKRHRRLGAIRGEDAEGRAFAAGQDHCQDIHRRPPLNRRVAPLGTLHSKRSNASSSTSALITTLRPTVTFGGICARLPTIVGPV